MANANSDGADQKATGKRTDHSSVQKGVNVETSLGLDLIYLNKC